MPADADQTSAPAAEAGGSLWLRVAGRYLFPLLCALMAARLGFAAARIGLALGERWDNSFPEGAIVARAWDGARGLPVYQDWRAWPHAFAPYSPLVYYLPAWAARATGSADHPWNLYLAGRLQSFAALCALAGVVAALARRAGATGAWRALAVCACFAWDPLLNFTASYRPDGPEAALSLLAIWIVSGGAATPARASAAMASLSLAWWFKATPWGASAVVAWWLLATSARRGLALGAGAAAAGLNLAIALAVNHATGGMLFLNMIGSLDNGWQAKNFLTYFSAAHVFPECLMFFGAGAAALALRGEGPAVGSRVWLLRAAPATLVIALAQLFKDGADINYFIEPYALGCAIAAAAIQRAWAGGPWPAGNSGGVGRAALWVGLGALALWDCGRSLSHMRAEIRAGIEHRSELDVTRRAMEIEGPILSLNPYLALRRPAPPTVMDFVQWNILVRRGRLNPEPLMGRIRTEAFAAVIVSPRYIRMDRPTRFIDELKTVIHLHYEKAEDYGPLWLMLPRGRPDSGGSLAGPPAP